MKAELKVGILFATALVSLLAIAFFMGLINPFSNTNELNILYNYAGGIEEGSPVRVMGIKVGRVKKIEFDPTLKSVTGEEVKLRIRISIENKAWSSVRKDSKFFINLAGVIGEKFLEISPGSVEAEQFKSGEDVRGEDPPRVDQLISQSYGLAGKIIEIVEKNEGSASNIVAQMDKLITNFNKTLVLLDQTSKNKEMSRLLSNTVQISDDLAYLTREMRSKKAEETYALIRKLIFRLEDVDGPQIKKFLQQEGVRARIF
jgi:phospholipid/cholesterol/gamma-HCH transport system substrate-binding protein